MARSKIQFHGQFVFHHHPTSLLRRPKRSVQLGEGARSFWRFYRTRSGFLEEGTRRLARERRLEVQIKGAATSSVVRSIDRHAELSLLTEGRSRLSRLESQQLEAPRQPEPRVTELEQRIQALVRECDASCCHPSVASGKPIWCSERCQAREQEDGKDGAKSSGRVNTPKTQRECWNCGETGHQHKDCWVNLGRWPQQQSQGHSNSPGKGSDAKGKPGKGGGKKGKSKDAGTLVWNQQPSPVASSVASSTPQTETSTMVGTVDAIECTALDLCATALTQQEIVNPRWTAC